MAGSVPAFFNNPDLRLLLFGGKGGVGKTTCAAASALTLAKDNPHRQFQVLSIDPAHSLFDVLGKAPLPPNLVAREIDFHACLDRFKSTHGKALREILQNGTILDAGDSESLLNLSVPGFEELMAYQEIARLIEEDLSRCLIVDTAPTGHTLRFLELPDWMRGWIAALDSMLEKHRFLAALYGGQKRRDRAELFLEEITDTVERLESTLQEPSQCRFVPVMLAESLSTQETVRLTQRLQKLEIPVTDIVVNRLYPVSGDCFSCQDFFQAQQGELSLIRSCLGEYRLWSIPLRSPEITGPQPLLDTIAMLSQLPSENRPSIPEMETIPAVENPVAMPGNSVSVALLAGKGGVGKTTVACALALRLAERYQDKSVLLFSTDPAHSLSDCLKKTVGKEGVEISPRLFAIEGKADVEFARLKALYRSEVKAAFRAAMHNPHIELEFEEGMVRQLLDLTPPGLDEIMALLKALEYLESGRFNLLVLDTSPTGHFLRLLELPDLMESWLKVAFNIFLKNRALFQMPKITSLLIGISKGMKKLRALLANPEKSSLMVVAILTELALEETRDLIAGCQRNGVPVSALVLNLATPPGGCNFCSEIRQRETKSAKKFLRDFSNLKQSFVYRGTAPRGVESLSALGQKLFNG